MNRLYQNIVWSQRGNFLSVPTDCPQRDERLGWMGDAQVFAPTAARNADVAAFFTKWMVDVNDGQSTNGDFADVSPRVSRPQPAMPVWGDAGVIIPVGDVQDLRRQSFSRGQLSVHGALGGLLRKALAQPDFDRRRRRPPRARAHADRSGGHRLLRPFRQLVAKAAALLGKSDDAAKYDKLFHDITDAFNQNFVSTNGVIQGDTQTGYILALQFGLLPENSPRRRRATSRRRRRPSTAMSPAALSASD